MFFFVKHIKMANLSEYELGLIPRNRSIKNYKIMVREKLLSAFDERERNLNTLSEKVLVRIAKTQNLSQNELNQIIKM